MKRDAPSQSSGRSGNGEGRSAKVRCQESPSRKAGLLETEHSSTESQQPPCLVEPDFGCINPDRLEARTAQSTHLTSTTAEPNDGIYRWIPAPSEAKDIESISEPASEWSRPHSISTDDGRIRSVSSENDDSSPARDTRSAIYEIYGYGITLEMKGCFMRESRAGPMPEDIAFCERLLREPVQVPQGTLFDDEYLNNFQFALQNRSKERLLVDLHPLMMPSAENQFIRGKKSLKNVIDGYNEIWEKSIPIYGPRPQPDHARCLRWTTFSEDQRRKLGIQPDESSLYTARDDMFFPYLTAEVKDMSQYLEFADRQNMHSMCIALRAVVSLYQEVGLAEELHRRILGFSISHDVRNFRIYGHYPEVEDGKVLFYRWLIADHGIWSKEHRWMCYRFVQNVDREFLPMHIERVMRILDQLPEPGDNASSVVDALDSQVPFLESQTRLEFAGATSSQSGSLQQGIRSMVQTMQQQLDDQKDREEKRDAEYKERQEKREAEYKERQEKREAEFKEREREQKVRDQLAADERKQLLAQLEQQREQNALQARLVALLEQNTKSN